MDETWAERGRKTRSRRGRNAAWGENPGVCSKKGDDEKVEKLRNCRIK